MNIGKIMAEEFFKHSVLGEVSKMTEEQDKFNNFVEFISTLVRKKFYGEVNVKMENGCINLGKKIDTIKFDNKSYIEYSSK
jgi:hypothetical protein